MTEAISIHDVLHNIKQDHPSVLPQDLDLITESSLSNGVIWKNKTIEVVASDPYHNKILERQSVFYYYICPHCERRCRKLYYIPVGEKKRAGVLCRQCGNVRGPRVNNSQNRLINSYNSLMKVISGNVTKKKKRQLLNSVVNNMTKSSPEVRDHYVAVVMTTLQKYLIRKLTSADTDSKDYKRAIKDMLEVIKTLGSVLYFHK